MRIEKFAIAFLCLGLSACSTTGIFSGRVTDTEGKPVSDVNVQFWQNKWVPLHLPERVAVTKTGSDGSYEITIKKHVSFIVIEDDSINYSKSVKPIGKANKYRNEIEVPKI